MNIQRGFRGKLEGIVNFAQAIVVEIQITGAGAYDHVCFGVDAAAKLSDDRYMVFFNQLKSPEGEIIQTKTSTGANYLIDLNRLPLSIDKLSFTVTVDGGGSMKQCGGCSFSLKQNGNELLRLDLSSSDFENEKSLIVAEIYRKNGWRVSALGSGFNGGLPALLKYFGGEEIQPSSVQAPVPKTPLSIQPLSTKPISLSKISLKKGEKISLAKNFGSTIVVENGWTAANKDYDLKALVRYRNGKTIYVGAANRDESLQTPEGAVRHGGDVRLPGELEKIYISWHPDIASVAVSSYSALENGQGSFKRYGVFVRILNGNQEVTISAQDASASDVSYTLCFGEIIFGSCQGEMDVINLEMYSRPNSEKRIGYRNGKVMMDIGPEGRTK